MSIATSILPTVRNAVKKYGNTLTLRQEGTNPVWNPVTQKMEGGSGDIDTTFKGAVEIASLEDEKGTIIRGDLIITAVFDDVEPSSTGNIIYNNREYGIVDINPLYFQDVLMVYQIVGRNG